MQCLLSSVVMSTKVLCPLGAVFHEQFSLCQQPQQVALFLLLPVPTHKLVRVRVYVFKEEKEQYLFEGAYMMCCCRIVCTAMLRGDTPAGPIRPTVSTVNNSAGREAASVAVSSSRGYPGQRAASRYQQ